MCDYCKGELGMAEIVLFGSRDKPLRCCAVVSGVEVTRISLSPGICSRLIIISDKTQQFCAPPYPTMSI